MTDFYVCVRDTDKGVEFYPHVFSRDAALEFVRLANKNKRVWRAAQVVVVMDSDTVPTPVTS